MKRAHIHIDTDGKLLCLVCNTYKLEEEFDVQKDNHHRKQKDRRCKKCKSEQRERRRVSSRGNGSVERVLLERFLGARDRANKHKLDFNITKEDLIDLWNIQNELCAISKIKMTHIIFSGRVPTNVSIDRINPLKGYTKGNVQLVCMAVNQMKNDLTMDELLFFCEEIIKYNGK